MPNGKRKATRANLALFKYESREDQPNIFPGTFPDRTNPGSQGFQQ